ncbi:MAG: formylglycine-generating enzyme family protein [Deltaproteobacteria bacterium]|nr:formylglycine-generating enzyme family protein [Deltaproteobacteria bacterium]
MKTWVHGFLLAALAALLAVNFACSCGDDDDDSAGGDDDTAADDDADDDSADDDVDDDDTDDDVDDDTDDDTDDDVPETTEGFVYAPAGSFTMGSPAGEPGHRDNEEQHDVTLTHHFEILESEVTQGMFKDVMGYNPSFFHAFGQAPNKPVEQVSWYDALAYANELSARHGLDACYTLTDIVCANDDPGDTTDYCMNDGGIKGATVALDGVDSQYDCEGFRLPTEAEWEYAARAGTATAHYGGDVLEIGCTPRDANLDPIAWYCGNAALETHPVKTRAANDWGLYDMIGNLMEWTGDDYHTDPGGDATDPEAFDDAYYRAVRGTSMRFHSPRRARAAYRAAYTPKYRERWIGFRLARTLPPDAEKNITLRDFRVPHGGGAFDAGPMTKDLPGCAAVHVHADGRGHAADARRDRRLHGEAHGALEGHRIFRMAQPHHARHGRVESRRLSAVRLVPAGCRFREKRLHGDLRAPRQCRQSDDPDGEDFQHRRRDLPGNRR